MSIVWLTENKKMSNHLGSKHQIPCGTERDKLMKESKVGRLFHKYTLNLAVPREF